MRTIALMILVAVALAACSCDETPKRETLRLEIVSVMIMQSDDVMVAHDNGQTEWLYEVYRVQVRIHGADGWPGVVQEVGQTLGDEWCNGTSNPSAMTIEYFDIGGRDWQWHDDFHGDIIGSTRNMVLYPGKVAGVDMASGGFAMLPANKDGSATYVSPYWWQDGLNATYTASHEVRGIVADCDRSKAIRWSIAAEPEGLRIVIDGESHWYPA